MIAEGKTIKSRTMTLPELSITLFVLLSFTVQIFSHIMGSNSLLIIVIFTLGLLIVSLNARSATINPSVFRNSAITIIVVAFNMFRPSLSTEFSINKFVILFVYFAGFALLIFVHGKSDDYYVSIKIILAFSVFYALSVWFQVIFPDYYRIFLRMMPVPAQERILRLAANGTNYTGFTHNPGITAGYIVTGIMLLTAGWKAIITNINVKIIVMIFLTVSLFMTGKRAHAVFALLALVAAYTIPYHSRVLWKRIFVVAVVALILFLLLFSFWDILIEIPLFSRINASIRNLVNGTNTELRGPLYSLAWSHFREKPLFGIGWGNFRYTVTGTVTRDTEFEVHNVYLQLLSETGVIGFLLIAIPLIALLIITIIHVRRMKEVDKDSWFALLSYSLMYQTFFVLYGFTENPLYNPSYLMMYFFSVSITLSFIRYVKQQQVKRLYNS